MGCVRAYGYTVLKGFPLIKKGHFSILGRDFSQSQRRINEKKESKLDVNDDYMVMLSADLKRDRVHKFYESFGFKRHG